MGGFGSAVAEFYATKGLSPRIKFLGFSDGYVEHGAPTELMRDQGLYREGIAQRIRDFVTASEVKKEKISAKTKK